MFDFYHRPEEQAAREEALSQQMRLLRKELPAMLAQLTTIPDPRDRKKRWHKLTSLLLYGLLMFVFQFASRRETGALPAPGGKQDGAADRRDLIAVTAWSSVAPAQQKAARIDGAGQIFGDG
jgi:hypothetical protein